MITIGQDFHLETVRGQNGHVDSSQYTFEEEFEHFKLFGATGADKEYFEDPKSGEFTVLTLTTPPLTMVGYNEGAIAVMRRNDSNEIIEIPELYLDIYTQIID